jgi:hypothetical protein
VAKARKAPRPERAAGDATADIRVRLFDGTRSFIDSKRTYLLRLLDGEQRRSVEKEYRGADRTFSVPFHDSFADTYTVLVSADDCGDAGFYPLNVNPSRPAAADLMLVAKDPQFDFGPADWDRIQQQWPVAYRALAFGASAAAARARYDALLGMHLQAAALWNIVTSMRDVHLPQATVLDYVREVIWDAPLGPAQDRFFAYADVRLIEQVETATAQGTFAPEPHPGLFHPEATRSWKEIRFGEANLQLTFHEKVTKKVNGETWVRMEPDIDYYKDLGGHALLEVLPNTITGGKTNPVSVYVLRWIAGRHAGVSEFNPPYTIVGP